MMSCGAMATASSQMENAQRTCDEAGNSKAQAQWKGFP
jgi:hypothetical protein